MGSGLTYHETEPGGHPNINCRFGTVRLWYRPHWTSGSGPGDYVGLFQLGHWTPDASAGVWGLSLTPDGATIQFGSQSNGVSFTYFAVPITLRAGRWYQLALTYSPTNVALYTNGVLATGSDTPAGVSRPIYPDGSYGPEGALGIFNYPQPTTRAAGLNVGTVCCGTQTMQGEMDELETFNYPLTAQQIGRDFPNFNGASGVMVDSDYDGRSDALETNVDGTLPTNDADAAPCRLGYWRFNEPTWTGEQGQVPVFTNGLCASNDWSGTALDISSSGRLTYRDVETNGWANFNCKHGAVRFWYKPSTMPPPSQAPFLSVGNNANWWALRTALTGNGVAFEVGNPASGDNIFFTVYTNFDSGHWYHVAFNYSTNLLTLYVNGTLITNLAVSSWSYPDALARSNTFTVGSWPGGGASLNGCIDELETFNYALPADEITRSFNTVKSVDSDLNGTNDLLEEITLSTNTPFAGVPFTVTGVAEAEQFDLGGEGVGYHTTNTTARTTDYRVCAVCVTNCDDLGGGYCVDKLSATDWLEYSVDVRVGQYYTIEPRAAGIGTNGAFSVEFITNNVTYSSNNLVLTSTNWANLALNNIYLAGATNTMRVRVLTNGTWNGVQQTGALKLNYASIYPYLGLGITNADVGCTNNVSPSALVADQSDWASARANSVAIQNAIDTLASCRIACVRLPAGRFYIASQDVTSESGEEKINTAIYVGRNDLQIIGAGKTSTVLVGHNRAVTALYVGGKRDALTGFIATAVTNFALADLTLEGSPHWVYDATVSNRRHWEAGGFRPNAAGGNRNTGCPFVCCGPTVQERTRDILVTNCSFTNACHTAITAPGGVNNLAVRSCDIVFWANGSNGTFSGEVTDTACPTTGPYQESDVGVWLRYSVSNIVVTDCHYDGNVTLTNPVVEEAGDGLAWLQTPGASLFAARNGISNYLFEAVQCNTGPFAAVQNTFFTFDDTHSTCALNNSVFTNSTGASCLPEDLSFGLVGNVVTGGRMGVLGGCNAPQNMTNASRLVIAGNTFSLRPCHPRDANGTEFPQGAAVFLWGAAHVNLSGNLLAVGESGLLIENRATNLLVLRNDFAAASVRAVDDLSPPGGPLSSQILKNRLACGVSVHLRAPIQDGSHYFLLRNNYLDTNAATVGLFREPLALPVHFQP